MMEFNSEAALEFAGKMDDIRKSLSNVSPYEMVEALGLDRNGLNSTQTVLSMGIEMDVKNGMNLKGQNQLFRLGITLGRAYERKLAANADTNSAGEDV